MFLEVRVHLQSIKIIKIHLASLSKIRERKNNKSSECYRSISIFFFFFVKACDTLIMSQLLQEHWLQHLELNSGILSLSTSWMKALQSQVLEEYMSCMLWTQASYSLPHQES